MNIALDTRFLFQRVLTFIATVALSAGPVAAQTNNDSVKFLNDWRWEGPAAPLLMALDTTFRKAKLTVNAAPGTGSAATVAKVATGEFDMGFGDFATLIEYASKNPASAPPVAVYVVYERSPTALFIRTASGAKNPKDLGGKTLGAPAFDSGRKLWPVYAALADVPSVQWQNLDAAQRETAFAAGKVDGITGFYFTTILNLEAKGLSGRDYSVHRFYESGLRLYGNVLIVNPAFLRDNPKTVERFVQAYHTAMKSTIRDTEGAIKYVKAYDEKTDERLEWRRLRLAIDQFIVTPTVETEGLGTINLSRVETAIKIVSSALKLGTPPTASAIASTNFLPSAADRRL